ncbi:MAG: formate dehydrogenase subunit alpha [Alphaproteobacteria bacterium]|nr:formate dehydrogenase subunit alpha [Alphaproteobacteria bacterium]
MIDKPDKSAAPVLFMLDGREALALTGETIWQAAARIGTVLPHLCYAPEPGYRADGNCRVCMVEIEGERALAPSCLRCPEPGMIVNSAGARPARARRMVLEMLLADQPAESHDPASRFGHWITDAGLETTRLPAREAPPEDVSHPAMAVNLDACIHCNLCVRACREVQINDVIGMAGRGSGAKIVFDFDDPMDGSTCVACGECVQACPTGALMPKTALGAPRPDRRVDSVCPYCGVGCQITYSISEDRLVSVEGRSGPANEQRLCVKGRFGFDYISHPERLTHPLVRREDAPKGMNVDPARPLTHFREASWEEALDRAAAGLVAAKDKHGNRALAGFGSAKGSNEEAYLFQKLVRTGFGSNNVDHCTRLCHASSVAALLEGIGSGAVTATFNEVRNADALIVIGANPTENHPVAATYFKQAAKRGAALIVMDPRGQALKRHATHMLQFRPGRDVAMLNAIMHTIIAEELYDQQYIATHTADFEALKDHLVAFPPESMAPLCGIDADMLKEVARVYARAGRAMIFWGMGVSQHVHGTDNARCLIALALMCGHVGRPGTGLHPLRGQNNVQGASDAGLIPMMYPDYRRVAEPEAQARFEAAWGVALDPEPGLTVVEIVDAAHKGDVRAMYIMGENPAMSDPDATHAREAFARLDHLVVQDLFLTETAMFADVVLPASAWPEKDGTVTNTNRQVQRGRKAFEPPGTAREDWRIIQDIAQRMGLDWHYAHPRDIYAEMAALMPSLNHIGWERLEAESAVTYPSDGPDDPGHAVVFADRFSTGDGRARFVSAALTPPAEEPDADYPMVLTTGRQLEHWHTGAMTRRASMLDALEPEATASIAPADLRALGLAPGDRVRVETRRGAIELTARMDGAVPAGLVFAPFAYVEAAANKLTNPQLDPWGKIPEFKFCAARIVPAGEGPAAERS